MNSVIPDKSNLGFSRKDGNGPNTVSFSIPVNSLANYPTLTSVTVAFCGTNNQVTDEFDTLAFKYSNAKSCLIVRAKHKKKLLKDVEINGTAGYFAVTIQYGGPTSPITEICQLPGVLYDE